MPKDAIFYSALCWPILAASCAGGCAGQVGSPLSGDPSQDDAQIGSYSPNGASGGAGSVGPTGAAGNGKGSSSTGADGSAPGTPAPAGSPAITVTPRAADVLEGAQQAFAANVVGLADPAVTWSVTEGAAGGTVSATGVYVAPATAGTYHVVATSHSKASLSSSATISVAAAAAATPGVWTNVSPAGMILDSSISDNYGVQDVVVDPVRKSDLYAFVCHQGAWRSQDYGATWKKVSTGTQSMQLDAGKPWGVAIDPNPARDPATPPTLYTASGASNQLGVYKSTDGGVNWTHYSITPGGAGTQSQEDVYSFDVDLYNSAHVIAGFHEEGNIAESFDSGVTWKIHTIAAAVAFSLYPFFIDTGNPSTSSSTWLTVSQNGGGLARTTDSGGSWAAVDPLQHAHGSSEIFQAGGGVIYASGDNGGPSGKVNGIFRSNDYGAHWANVSQVMANAVVGTPSYLYATWGWAIGTSGLAPMLQRSPRSSGTSWTTMTTPAGMTNGWKRAAVTFDGNNYIIVGGSWNAGIWRYIEPRN